MRKRTKKKRSLRVRRIAFPGAIVLGVFLFIAIIRFSGPLPPALEQAPPAPINAPAKATEAVPQKEAMGPRRQPEEYAVVRPAWRKNAVSVRVPEGFAKIVIIIDDMGVDRRHSDEAAELPGPLTMSFLPYARHLDEQTKNARAQGHELMVHMPMEPMDPDLDMGPVALRVDMNAQEFDAMLEEGLSALGGYVGLNNHMGSRLTQDQDSMGRLMSVLKKRELLFVDSRTIAGSVADDMAAAYGVPHVSRDVFLDDDPSFESVRESLEHLERIAHKRGYAVAIGHPKPHTIAALKAWLPTLADKKLALVPASAVVRITAPAAGK